MSIQTGATFVIVNVKSCTVLDLSGGDNVSIIGFQRHDGNNQKVSSIKHISALESTVSDARFVSEKKWLLEHSGDGRWVFRNEQTGNHLSVGGPPENGAPLTAKDERFEWDIWPDPEYPGAFRIIVPNTQQCVDLSDHGNPTVCSVRVTQKEADALPLLNNR